jgi:disulfide oxidoreductase YuzD
LVLRTCEYLLEKKLKDKDLNIDFSCHFVDIYMDKLRDLGKSLDKKNKNDSIYDVEDMEITENLS